jgi:predicted amidohydrolase
MSHPLQIALIQAPLAWEATEVNLAYFSQQLSQMQPVDLVVLPEMFATGFTMKPQSQAEPLGGRAQVWMAEQAQKHQTAICGSLAVTDGGHFFNRMFFVAPDGTSQHYDKRHLFTLAGEHEHYTAGKSRVVVAYKGFRILLQVCYDLRFPVFARNRGDFDVMVYVANWPERRNQAWQTLLPARAIENQCFVIGVNRMGLDGNDIAHAGNSAVYDFEGNLLAGVAPHQAQTIYAALDLNALRTFREKLPFLNDADAFSLLDSEV